MKKNLLRTVLTLMLVTAAFTMSLAQQANISADPFSTEEAKDAGELRTINATFNKNKVYVNWTAVDASGECIYMVERSVDGINYQKITAKKGVPSPGNAPLMFSYTDEQPAQGRSYYRVVRVGASGTTATGPVTVNSQPVTENEVLSGIASNK